jgi:hypothetical protein
MLSVMEITIATTLSIFIAYGVGWLMAKRKSKTTAHETSQQLYEEAIGWAKGGDWVLSLVLLAKASGMVESHEIYNAMAIAWTNLACFDLAGEAYRKARHTIWQPSLRSAINGVGPKQPAPAQQVCEYFYHESLALARHGSWEFAFLRSNEAIKMIEEQILPRWTEYGDCESWLRLIRLISAMHYLQGSDALTHIESDAQWLLKHSRVEGYAEVAMIALSKESPLSTIRDNLMAAWRRYDERQRQLVHFTEQ